MAKKKFPAVKWLVDSAENFLENKSQLDLVVAGQAYQWMDRPRFLKAAYNSLSAGGLCVIAQNNRDYSNGGFAAEYEELLEKYSPGYKRNYREIDIEEELRQTFDDVTCSSTSWERGFDVEEFITMSASSTQAQRAVSSIGSIFFEHLADLCRKHLNNGQVFIRYKSESYTAIIHGQR